MLKNVRIIEKDWNFSMDFANVSRKIRMRDDGARLEREKEKKIERKRNS